MKYVQVKESICQLPLSKGLTLFGEKKETSPHVRIKGHLG